MTYSEPVFALLLVAAGSAALARRSRRTLCLALAALGLFCFPPAAWLASRLWEAPASGNPASAQVIVVLSGAVLPPAPGRPDPLPGIDTLDRCLAAAHLHHRLPHLPVLASGGGRTRSSAAPPYAEAMGRLLRDAGVPASHIWLETRSGSTAESAAFAAAILRPRGIRHIALVTEAYHLRRAAACFRKLGFTVTAVPCGQRPFSPRFLPSAQAIAWNESIVHEIAGILWYRLTGHA